MPAMGLPRKVDGHLATQRWPRQDLWTTLSNLARFAMEVQTAYASLLKLLSSALAHEVLAYQNEEIYGLGVALGQRRHPQRYWHSGAIEAIERK